jgi:ribosomal protein L11 methyltransferase
VDWWRLEMGCPPELEESLLWKLRSLGVTRLAVGHRPDHPDERLLTAWLPAVDGSDARRHELEAALAPLAEPFGLTLPPIVWQRQPEEDWSLSWKRHWRPDPVGERLLILPAWLEVPAALAGRLVIRMDPGSAFGTGSHPTTRLCLEALERWLGGEAGSPLPAAARLADLGCGSGILGLAGLRLGAAGLAAVDTDPLAVCASRTNAVLNGLAVEGPQAAVQVAEGSVERLAELLAGQPADLLLCNILAPVIEALCPAFERVLAPTGVGLLSGLLVEQAAPLAEVLGRCGWHAELTASQQGWGLLTIRRPGAAASDVA